MDILEAAGIMGFFAGLYALTGRDLDPQSILEALITLAVGSLGGNTGTEASQLWGQAQAGLVIYGIITLLIFAVSVLYCGKRGIITAACGYFGVLLLVEGFPHGMGALYLPLALIVVGIAAAKLLSDRGNLKIS